MWLLYVTTSPTCGAGLEHSVFNLKKLKQECRLFLNCGFKSATFFLLTYFVFYSPDQCRESITSYLKGEAGKLETNGSYSESATEAKTKPFAQEPTSSLGRQSDKETVKPKMPSSLRTEQQTISLMSHQRSLHEASKPAGDASKTAVPVSLKKTSWNTSEDIKPRPKAQEDEGATSSEQKV